MPGDLAQIYIKATDLTKDAFRSLENNLKSSVREFSKFEDFSRGLRKLALPFTIISGSVLGTVAALASAASELDKLGVASEGTQRFSETFEKAKDSISTFGLALANKAIPYVNTLIDASVKLGEGFKSYVIDALNISAFSVAAYGRALIEAATTEKTFSEAIKEAGQDTKDFSNALRDTGDEGLLSAQREAIQTAKRMAELKEVTEQAFKDIEKAEQEEFKSYIKGLEERTKREQEHFEKINSLLNELEESQKKLDLHILGNEAEEAMAQLEEAFKRGSISLESFYALKKQKTMEAADAEIEALKKSREALIQEAEEEVRIVGEETEKSLQARIKANELAEQIQQKMHDKQKALHELEQKQFEEIEAQGVSAYRNIGAAAESAGEMAVKAFEASQQKFKDFVSEMDQAFAAAMERARPKTLTQIQGEAKTPLPPGFKFQTTTIPTLVGATAIPGSIAQTATLFGPQGQQFTLSRQNVTTALSSEELLREIIKNNAAARAALGPPIIQIINNTPTPVKMSPGLKPRGGRSVAQLILDEIDRGSNLGRILSS